jgi:hypothetical protein
MSTRSVAAWSCVEVGDARKCGSPQLVVEICLLACFGPVGGCQPTPPASNCLGPCGQRQSCSASWLPLASHLPVSTHPHPLVPLHHSHALDSIALTSGHHTRCLTLAATCALERHSTGSRRQVQHARCEPDGGGCDERNSAVHWVQDESGLATPSFPPFVHTAAILTTTQAHPNTPTPQHLNHMTGASKQASATATSSSILNVPHSSPTRHACTV